MDREGETGAVRAAVTESTFREINEQLAAIGNDAGLRDVVCECARTDCTALVAVTDEEYDAVRTDGHHFVVAPDEQHVDYTHERVVVRNDRFWVVQKFGTAADVSEELEEPDSP